MHVFIGILFAGLVILIEIGLGEKMLISKTGNYDAHLRSINMKGCWKIITPIILPVLID